MKFKKKFVPAHREYFLQRGDDVYYDGRVYRSEAEAQKVADNMNSRRDIAKYGAITVGFKDLQARVALEGVLRL